MDHYLLIAEKPDLMNKIQSCYEKHKNKIPYRITSVAQSGHLVTLKLPSELDESLRDWAWETLPIDPERYGGWQYKVIEEKSKGPYMTPRERYDRIKKEIYSGKYDGVINAGDPDREGEFLVRLVLAHCRNKLPIKRFWTNDLTDGHILNALLNLRDDEKDTQLINLLNEGYGRQRADYLFGMNLSRAATLKMGARVACGRVKTPILSIVCKREDEIAGFVPETVYGVRAVYDEGFDGVLTGETEEGASSPDIEEDDDAPEKGARPVKWFKNRQEAENKAASLRRMLTITSYETKRQSSYAPKFFNLAAAQIEAGKMGYSAADTLRILQWLYEQKLLSYPRTSCRYLGGDEDFSGMLEAAGCVPELRRFTDSVSKKDIERVKSSKTWVNPKELEKEGHSALVPTSVHPDWPALDKEKQDIYRMVCSQFVASFLPPLVQDKTVLLAETDGNEFRSSGKTLIDPGWTAVFRKAFTDSMIPAHKKGDVLMAARYEVTEKTTQCPKRYTTADLIAICENPIKHLDNKAYKKLGKRLKIGTPATRASIIEELIVVDKYMRKEKDGSREVVVPTKIGKEIIENIHDCKICKVDLTGEWEEKLEKVRAGEMTLEEIDSYMLDQVTAQIEEFRSMNMRRIDSGSDYQRIGECPVCGETLMKGPKMYYCTGYRKGCKAGGSIEKNGAVISIDEFLNMLSGDTLTKKMTKNGKSWEQKIACEKSSGRIIYPGEYSQSEFTCPCCGKRILESAVAYSCEGRRDKSCEVFVSKAPSGKSIPLAQFRKLFTKGRSDVMNGFISKTTKKEYSAYMEADKAAKKISFRFSDPETPTDYKCPVCGKSMVHRGFRYACSGTCGFIMPATMAKKDIEKDMVERLISMVKSGEIKGGAQALVTKEDLPTGHRCPVCGGEMVRSGMWFKCADNGCGFSFFRIVAGHVLSDDETDRLIEEGTTGVITDFRSRKDKGKKNFSAELIVDVDEKKTTFRF